MTDKQRLPGRRTSGARASGILAELGPGLLVMDVDSTLIEQEVIELIAEHAGTREQVADITERAMRGELDFAASLRQRVSTLAGVSRTIFADVLDQVRLTPGAEELIAHLHASGCRIGVVVAVHRHAGRDPVGGAGVLVVICPSPTFTPFCLIM